MPGTSGGVTVAGCLAMAAGAAFVAIIARAISLPDAVVVIVAAGISGALADSLLGATLQEKRWCPACNAASERRVHDCGAPTAFRGGVAWIDNDAVNLFSTLVGAAVAAILATL